MKSTGKVHQVDSVGVFTPKHTETVDLKAGEVGFIIAGIKDIHGAPVGDTPSTPPTPWPAAPRAGWACWRCWSAW